MLPPPVFAGLGAAATCTYARKKNRVQYYTPFNAAGLPTTGALSESSTARSTALGGPAACQVVRHQGGEIVTLLACRRQSLSTTVTSERRWKHYDNSGKLNVFETRSRTLH